MDQFLSLIASINPLVALGLTNTALLLYLLGKTRTRRTRYRRSADPMEVARAIQAATSVHPQSVPRANPGVEWEMARQAALRKKG